MPFIPHTQEDIDSMLQDIGVDDINTLFDELPSNLRSDGKLDIPEGISEMELLQLVKRRFKNSNCDLSFIGAGAYEHHIPAAVWDIASRGEFLTAYTPYQAEASQGTLQLLYEFQTMLAELTGMEVANASMYEGGSALAEAVLMAVRCNRQAKSKNILVVGTLHPNYLATVKSIVNNQGIELVVTPFCNQLGTLPLDALQAHENSSFAAVVISQPNFMGALEAVDEITNWAHQREAKLIACVNPISLGLLKEPGSWGEMGADIVCGEGQSLGVPLASGGPYFGFLCCAKSDVRQMPGRIVGRTKDTLGRDGFTLTLQAREQHIRRSKATSNICTNQGLLATAATIYMSLLGLTGLARVASVSHHNTRLLLDKLTQIDGVEQAFCAPFFHEVVIRVPFSAEIVLESLAKDGILGGISLGSYFTELSDCILICVTETKNIEDLERYYQSLEKIITKEK